MSENENETGTDDQSEFSVVASDDIIAKTATAHSTFFRPRAMKKKATQIGQFSAMLMARSLGFSKTPPRAPTRRPP